MSAAQAAPAGELELAVARAFAPDGALARHESRGLHYTLDYPETLAEAKDTVLVP